MKPITAKLWDDLAVRLEKRERRFGLTKSALIRESLEQSLGAQVFTFDSHFEIYRHSGHRVIPLLMPPSS